MSYESEEMSLGRFLYHEKECRECGTYLARGESRLDPDGPRWTKRCPNCGITLSATVSKVQVNIHDSS